MIKILFVCHGNICRSPMAEFIMKKYVADMGLEREFYIESAATSREELGNDVYPPARRELERHGIACPHRRARQITLADYSEFDHLVCMDRNNIRNALCVLGSDPEGKLSLLLSHTSHPRDVADPWYTGDFTATWNDVTQGCRALLETVLNKK